MTCYIDTFSGVAGDMLLSALLDASPRGPEALLSEVKGYLHSVKEIAGEWDIELKSVTRSDGMIAAKHINVLSKYEHKPLPPPAAGQETAHDHSHGHSHAHEGHGRHDHSHGHTNHDASVSKEKSEASLGHDHSHGHTNHDANVSKEKSEASLGHDHSHGHGHNHNDHGVDVIRNLSTIEAMLSKSRMPAKVIKQAIAVFTELAVAEAATHGITMDNVHFHEVGAIDSIIDTCGVLLALHCLNIERVYCSKLPLGQGTVWTAHGLLPVPAPATARLMRGCVTTPGPKVSGELVTPTGASLIRVLCNLPSLLSDSDSDISSSTQGVLPPAGFQISSIGIGAGTKDWSSHPNIVRVMLGDMSVPSSLSTIRSSTSAETITSTAPTSTSRTIAGKKEAVQLGSDGATNIDVALWQEEEILLLQANIDDMTAEVLAYVMELLLESGARDVWIENIVMKKSRSASQLNVLCKTEDKTKLLVILFEQSSTIGIRIQKMERVALRREMVMMETPYGNITGKASYLGNEMITCKPEYADCAAIAKSKDVPLKTVIASASCEK